MLLLLWAFVDRENIHAWDAEVAAQVAQIFRVDRAEDADDGQLARSGHQHHHAVDIAVARAQINIRIVSVATLAVGTHTHDARPTRPPQFRAQFFQVAVPIFTRPPYLE